MVATRLTTAAELFALPGWEGSFELIKGERVQVSPTGFDHGLIAGEIATLIAGYLASHPVGRLVVAEAGFVLEEGPDTVIAPDVAVVAREHRRRPGYARFAPLLAVEVKSPSNTEAEIAERLAIYLRAGVQEVWWIRPQQRTLTVHRLDAAPESFRDGEIFSDSSVLQGIAIDLTTLFAV